MNTLDNFIVGDSNYHAYTILKELSIKDDVQVKQIFLVGPVSSGKTHLLESIAEAIRCRGRVVINDSAIVFCKPKMAKVAKYFWRMLHLQNGESCNGLISLS